jgi:hypothetical protein
VARSQHQEGVRLKAGLTLLLLSMLLVSTSCGKSKSEDSLEENHYSLDGDYFSEALPLAAQTFDAKIIFFQFNRTQQDKMEEAMAIIKMVVGTEEFRQKVLNYTYNGKKEFVDNSGLSNAQIYQKILEGAEKLQPAKNNIMNAEVELYYAANNTVGYTYPSSRRIWVNTKFFDNYTAAGVAHNLFHEWMHKLGFNHATNWSPSRDHSVPYALGYIIGQLGKDFL